MSIVIGEHRDAYIQKTQQERAAKGFSDAEISELETRCFQEGKVDDYQGTGIKMRSLQYDRGICFHWENKSKNKQLEETVQFKLTNMELVGKWKGQSSIKLVVPPGKTEFAVLKRSGAGSANFGLSKKVALRPV